MVAGADSIDGPWKVERMVEGESLGAPTQNTLRGGRGDHPTFTIVHHDPNEGGDPDVVARSTQFQVVDLGKGRVALQSADGRFVSAGDDGVALKDLDGKAPGEAESFQWVNLMRRDTMLMSLFNHRYLATQPNEPGPVRVSGTGPRPDRKGGACFQWKAGTQHW